MKVNAHRVIENSYFSAKTAFFSSDGLIYWDWMRKIPHPSGAAPEVLELLAHMLAADEGESRILLPLRDHALFQDLQVVGCRWIGYAVSKPGSDGPPWDLWGAPASLDVAPTSSIEAALGNDEGRFERLVVQVRPELSHDPRWGTREYLDFVRSRERYFTGLSATDYLRSKSLWQAKLPPRKEAKTEKRGKKSASRPIPQFADVVANRLSASSLGSKSTLTRKELDQVFGDAYLQRGDGHFPVATAGGLGSFLLRVVTSDENGPSSSCYLIDPRTGIWKPGQHPVTAEDLFKATFEQAVFKGCRTWLVLEMDLKPLADKYGNRAYRFAAMGAGALIQTLHLSCTSHGIRFRAAGGFDDGMLERLFCFSGSGYRRIMALAGLAK